MFPSLTHWTLIPDFRLGSSSKAPACTPELVTLWRSKRSSLVNSIYTSPCRSSGTENDTKQNHGMDSGKSGLLFPTETGQGEQAWEASSESRGFRSTYVVLSDGSPVSRKWFHHWYCFLAKTVKGNCDQVLLKRGKKWSQVDLLLTGHCSVFVAWDHSVRSDRTSMKCIGLFPASGWMMFLSILRKDSDLRKVLFVPLSDL